MLNASQCHFHPGHGGRRRDTEPWAMDPAGGCLEMLRAAAAGGPAAAAGRGRLVAGSRSPGRSRSPGGRGCSRRCARTVAPVTAVCGAAPAVPPPRRHLAGKAGLEGPSGAKATGSSRGDVEGSRVFLLPLELNLFGKKQHICCLSVKHCW